MLSYKLKYTIQNTKYTILCINTPSKIPNTPSRVQIRQWKYQIHHPVYKYTLQNTKYTIPCTNTPLKIPNIQLKIPNTPSKISKIIIQNTKYAIENTLARASRLASASAAMALCRLSSSLIKRQDFLMLFGGWFFWRWSTWSCSGSLASFLEIFQIISEHQHVPQFVWKTPAVMSSFRCSVWHLSLCDKAYYDQTREKRAEWFILQRNNSMSPSKMKQSQEDVTSQNFDFQKVYFELLQFMKQKWNIYRFVQFPKMF